MVNNTLQQQRFSLLADLHCVSRKVPTFELSVTLSNLNRFSKCLHWWKAYEICYNPVRHCSSHLRHVTALPWEIKNSNFLQIVSSCGRKCKQIAFVIASTFANCSLYWLQIKFFYSLLFYLFTFAINLWHREFVTADVTAVSVNNQHGIKRSGQDFDKTFIWNQYEERLAILNTENITICKWTTKLEAIKM